MEKEHNKKNITSLMPRHEFLKILATWIIWILTPGILWKEYKVKSHVEEDIRNRKIIGIAQEALKDKIPKERLKKLNFYEGILRIDRMHLQAIDRNNEIWEELQSLLEKGNKEITVPIYDQRNSKYLDHHDWKMKYQTHKHLLEMRIKKIATIEQKTIEKLYQDIVMMNRNITEQEQRDHQTTRYFLNTAGMIQDQHANILGMILGGNEELISDIYNKYGKYNKHLNKKTVDFSNIEILEYIFWENTLLQWKDALENISEETFSQLLTPHHIKAKNIQKDDYAGLTVKTKKIQ